MLFLPVPHFIEVFFFLSCHSDLFNYVYVTELTGEVLLDGLPCLQVGYGTLRVPQSPLLRNVSNPEDELSRLLDGYHVFEERIGYKFRDRSYLLQSLTHASYSPNRLTDCYQRLEFLGDAVLGSTHVA
jgi:endoribonuclease Dicer